MTKPEQERFAPTPEPLLDPRKLDKLVEKWKIPREDILLVALKRH